MRALYVLVGSVLIAAAAATVLVARDVAAWRDELAAADARFEVGEAAAWTVDERLPGLPAARLLAVGDDRRVRQALERFRRAYALERDELRRLEAVGARGEAVRLLARIAATGDARAAAQASVLTGILEFDERDTERAVAAFRDALRHDPGNAAAKYDLELALRLLLAVGRRPGESGTGRASGRRGTGADEGGGGY